MSVITSNHYGEMNYVGVSNSITISIITSTILTILSLIFKGILLD